MSLHDPKLAATAAPRPITPVTAIIFAVQLVVAAGIALLLSRGQFFSAFLAGGVLMLPVLFQKISLRLPPEIQLAAVLFAFTTLFLGEVQDYYERYWWWDLVIHFSSGLLLGAAAVLILYMHRARRTSELDMPAGLVALFAFFFAVGVGAIWEVFEFVVDRSFGTAMQKPRPGDASGLTDTMWDMSVNIAGAAIVALLCWRQMRRSGGGWIRSFVRRNPQLFDRSTPRT